MAWHSTTFTGKDYNTSSSSCLSQVEHQSCIRKVKYYEFLHTDEDEERGWTRPTVSYGPFYCDLDSRVWTERKRNILQHVITASATNITDTVTVYMEAIQKVEDQARALYVPEKSLSQLSGNEFRWMMIKDGCFCLVVALFALGGKKQLALPPRDPMFGEQWNKEEIKLAISSMFYVGNQIPLVVLKELMKQNFFQRVLNTGKWKQPMDLPRKALLEFLVVPMLDSGGPLDSLLEKINPVRCLNKGPCDLLHGLWLLMMGPGNSIKDDDDSDYYGDCPAVRSAKELREVGIFFKDNKELGARGIRFKKDMFNGVLALPRIFVDSDTKLLFWNLIHYEATQQLGEEQREVSAYLQFMRELIRSPEDVKLLTTYGIILADTKSEEDLPWILCRLPLKGVRENCNLHLVRDKIRNYSQPSKWEKLRNLLSLVLLLTVVETAYTILGYYKKAN